MFTSLVHEWPQLTIQQKVPVPRIDRIVNLLVVLVMLPIFASTFLFPGMDASGGFWIFLGGEGRVWLSCAIPSGARGCSSSDSQLWFWCIITLQTVRVRKGADCAEGYCTRPPIFVVFSSGVFMLCWCSCWWALGSFGLELGVSVPGHQEGRYCRAETMLDHWQTSIDTWWSHWEMF